MYEVVLTTREYAKRYASAILNVLFKDYDSVEYQNALKNLQSVINSDSFIQQVGSKEFSFDHDPEADARTDLGESTEQADYPN